MTGSGFGNPRHGRLGSLRYAKQVQGRRRTVRRVFEEPLAELAGQCRNKTETRQSCSFSPGEKVRMRASHNTNFAILISRFDRATTVD